MTIAYGSSADGVHGFATRESACLRGTISEKWALPSNVMVFSLSCLVESVPGESGLHFFCERRLEQEAAGQA